MYIYLVRKADIPSIPDDTQLLQELLEESSIKEDPYEALKRAISKKVDLHVPLTYIMYKLYIIYITN